MTIITELAMYNALRSLEQKVQAIEPENCTWTERVDWMGEIDWVTACGTSYCIGSESPSENQYHFCPNCGKPIHEVPLTQEAEE